MIDWLLDTIVWTAALIVLVLIVRRPVARWFGPQIAYALWGLPILRLFLPPLELPAWMAPQALAQRIVPTAEMGSGHGATAADTPPIGALEFTLDTMPVLPGEPSLLQELPVTEIALALWAIGVCVFLYSRFNAYFMMRSEMLASAREVGRAEGVRLLETPATSSPLAFGVRDRIVALPEGFMAHFDRDQRDLALAHELAHHKGHDLLVNMLAQPLFAIHWFNPLARVGWLALRRDQEAACDARVISERCAGDRALYASVIAGFAAGPNVALAAPMACPVLGDKSIIHRLRSLKMSEFSTRRRLAGRGLLAAALLALPLTASISYAESKAPKPPALQAGPVLSPNPAPSVPPAPPAPVAPIAPTGPAAPPAPIAPLAPMAPLALQAIGQDAEVEHETYVVREIRKDRETDRGGDGKSETDKDGKTIRKESRRHIIIQDKDGRLSEEERADMMRELREGLAEMDVEIEEAMAEARIAIKEVHAGEHGITKVNVKCSDGSQGSELRNSKGQKMTRICRSEVMAHALAGLKEARNTIADSAEMPGDIREQVLKTLDEKIANWDKNGA